MKKLINSISILFVFFLIAVGTPAQPIPKDKLYLGQTPPGNTPKVFNLPVTTGVRPAERIAITSDEKEIYYGELDAYPPTNQRIKYFKFSDNKWQGPFTVFEGFRAPWLSSNDSTMYMQKHVGNLVCTFFSKRTNSGWSTPARLFSKNQQTHYFQITNLNNSFVSSFAQGAFHKDICRFLTTNADTLIQSLGNPINTKNNETDFFISSDESYMFLIRANSFTASDIFISYKKDNGTWTNPKLVGEPISTPNPNWEYGQYVTRDNKYLFFTRGGVGMDSYNIYWVKIDNVIDSLKHTNFIPYLKNQIGVQSIQVGRLFSFTLPAETFIDDDGNNTLTYSAVLIDGTPLPSWLSFNSATQTFSGVLSEAGSLKIKVTATDTSQAFVSSEFEIIISK